MRAKSVALLLLALGCGLVASIGITQVISKKNTEPAAAPGDTTPVYVAMEDVAFGESLTEQVIRLENWPKDKAPPGALGRLEDIEGRRTRTKLFAGTAVLENMLFAQGASEQGYATTIPKGYRVVSVKVDKVSGSGLILPGDRVDVLVHLIRNPGKGIPQTNTQTILQDVKVFAVNDVVDNENSDDKTITAQTISLLVTPEHAQKVMLAEELGKIRMIMRSPEDDEIADVEGTSPDQLFDMNESEDRANEDPLAGITEPDDNSKGNGGVMSFLDSLARQNQAAPAIIPTVTTPSSGITHHMQIVSGADVREVVLEKEEGTNDGNSAVERWRMSEGRLASVPVVQPAPAIQPSLMEPPTMEPTMEPEPVEEPGVPFPLEPD